VTPRAAASRRSRYHCDDEWGQLFATAEVDFLVFLNRKASGLRDCRVSQETQRVNLLRQVLYGMPKTIARQGAALERLLAIDVLNFVIATWIGL